VADANIEVDVIIQNVSKDGKTDFSFTVPQRLARTMELLKDKVVPQLGAADVVGDPRSARSASSASACAATWAWQQDVPHAERRGHQHPDDLHQRDQDLGRDRREVHGAGRARPAPAFDLDMPKAA
jgi:hypothetical protein